MKRYKRFFEENIYSLTIEDIYDKNYRSLGREQKFNYEFITDNYEEHPEWFIPRFKLFSDAINKALKILGSNIKYYYEKKTFLDYFLMQTEFPDSIQEWFPIPIYVSESSHDKNTIGILVYFDGKKELFEGNDEASDETYLIINKLLGNIKPIKVYCMQDNELAEKIRHSKEAPEGLYVSPDKKYASGYWSLEQDRILFSFTINTIDVRQESDVDWKLRTNTNILNFKYE